jgi:chromosome partitioning protein
MFRKRRSILRRWLKANYDFTIVDCPPSIAIQVKTFLEVGDSFIVPSIPDRLSVRGSLHLLDRIKRMGVKIEPLGTLWSLYRKQNQIHCDVIEATEKRIGRYAQLPRPFEAVIPNAAKIAEATEPDLKPRNFNAKYTAEFARLYRGLCGEIVQRSQWQAARTNGAMAAVTG